MKKKLLITSILILLIVAGFLFYSLNNSQYASGNSPQKDISGNSVENNNNQIANSQIPQSYTIEITSSGFSPKSLTINQGDTVTFANKNTMEHWPASALHPTHTVYPGSDIQKCGTSEGDKIFDSCTGLNKGESFSFTFNEKGDWRYHDHLNPNLNGVITVQ